MIELIVLIGMGGFMFFDWRRGFPATKAVIHKIQSLQQDKLPLSPVKAAEKILVGYSKAVADLKDSVAQVKANQRSMKERALEQEELIEDVDKIIEEALSKGKEDIAIAAANKKINYEARKKMYDINAGKQTKVAAQLQQEFDTVSNILEMIETDVDTIRVQADIASANQQLHDLLSKVNKVTGLGFKAQMESLVNTTENDKFRTEELLAMDVGSRKVAEFKVNAKITKELEKARERIAALPAHADD